MTKKKADSVHGLTATEMVVLAKCLPEAGDLVKEARAQLAPGPSHVDFTVRFQGSVSVGDDYLQKPTARLLSITTLAFLLKRMGCTREAATKHLAGAFQESQAFSGDKKAQALLARQTGIEQALLMIDNEIISKMTPTKCRGPVSLQVSVKRLEEEG